MLKGPFFLTITQINTITKFEKQCRLIDWIDWSYLSQYFVIDDIRELKQWKISSISTVLILLQIRRALDVG